MKNSKKVRLDNELIEIFTNIPKSTNTAMSWLLLHKSMVESLNSDNNNMKFNLLSFIEDYNLDIKRKDHFKEELIRDFKKLKNRVEKEYINEKGEKNIKTYYFFQETNINLDTLDVEIKLNDEIYQSVSSIPNKNYFQYLKQEAIMIANKKMTPIDIKMLMFIKSKSHNAKISYVKIDIDKLYYIIGQSKGTRFAVIKKRHIDPFIDRALKNTNYVISYKVQKNRLNMRKIESILFTIDNRKEKVNIINTYVEKDTPYDDQIAQKHMTELEPYIKEMKKHENEVQSKVSIDKNKQKDVLLNELMNDTNKVNFEKTRILDENWGSDNIFDFEIDFEE